MDEYEGDGMRAEVNDVKGTEPLKLLIKVWAMWGLVIPSAPELE